MKLFKSIIPVLVAALAVGFTGCSDEDYEDYAEGLKSPGAFFAKNLAGSYKVAETATTLEVPVQRTDASAPSSYAITLTDESGLFSVPATVSFAGESLESAITVSFDPEKLEYDKAYAMSLTLGDATEYGDASYSFTITKSMPVVREKAGPEGLGTYTYTILFDDVDVDLNCYYEYNTSTPNKRTYYLEKWANNVTLRIDMPDATAANADGLIPVYVPVQPTEVSYSDGSKFNVGDPYSTYMALGRPDVAEKYKDASYYDPATGRFTLLMFYLLPDGRGFDPGYEYLELAGFPDYSVSAEYTGLFYDTKNNASVIGKIDSGADVDKVVTALVLTNNEQEAIQAVIDGKVADAQEVAGGQPVTVQYSITEGGKYYMVAVSYGKNGKAQESAAVRVNVALGGSEWETIGTGEMQDGWVIPAFLKDPSMYVEFTFDVEIAKSKEREGVYALINPYGENNPLTQAGVNKLDGTGVVEFTIDGSYVSFVPQMCGFADTNGEFIIMNREGDLEDANPGVSHAAIKSFMESKGMPLSSYEDGLVTVPLCLFTQVGDEDKLYANFVDEAHTEYAETLIAMPNTSAAAVAKAKAKRIAAPKVKGLVSHFSNKYKKNETLRMNRIAVKKF